MSSRKDSSKKAIIVAAGRGKRLGVHTDEIPKCMVPVNGRPILHRQLEALTRAGVDDVVIIRGYQKDRIDPGPFRARFVENPAWETNNILASLMYAEAEMVSGFFFSYADIVYAPYVATRLAAAAGTPGVAAALIVDRKWDEAYVGRTLHPVSEAELTAVDETQTRITQVGKQAVPQGEAVGEFIGLAYVSAEGGRALIDTWKNAVATIGPEAPFGRAPRLRQAYLTDALNALIGEGRVLAPVFIDGQWREIDTAQDLERAEAVVDTWT